MMRRFTHRFLVNAEISKVWDFYTDIRHLDVISPPTLKLRVVKCTHQKIVEGSEVWLTGILLTRSNWHSKITSLEPYEYVDEMLSGRFRVWKHTHGFRSVGEDQTEVIDDIEFALHYGIIGRMFEGYVLRHLEKVFRHRMEATKAELEKA